MDEVEPANTIIFCPVFDFPAMNRTFWIDLIRVVGAFLVVAIHVSGRTAGGYAVTDSGETVGSLGWLASLSICSLSSSVAVPLFVLVSGALLLGRSEETIPFYRKRFGKILLPFLGWSTIFVLCLWIAGRSFKDGTPITLFNSIGAFVSGDISGHFWFMYMLVSLYLVAPFLSVFVRNASKNMLTCFLILWFIAVVIFPVINRAARESLGITGIAEDFRFEFVSLWVGFFIAGYILKDVVISKHWAVIALVLWFCLAMTSPMNTYLLRVYPDSSMTFLFIFSGQYIVPIVSHQVTLTLIVFLALRSLGDLPSLASSRFGRLVVIIAPLTFGIYLCHHLFVVPSMEILDRIVGLGSTESWLLVLFAIPTLTILFYLVAAGMVYLIRQSRYLKALLAP